MPTRQLKDLGLKGLLPLLLLTKEGKNRAIVEDIIAELCVDGRQSETELLSLAYGLASLIFRDEADQSWLRRRFSMLDDLLNESWAFQEILQKGLEKGLEKGREEGREEGLTSSRSIVLALVEHSYPSLLRLAKEKVSTISDMAALQNLVLQVSLASHEDEVRAFLQ